MFTIYHIIQGMAVELKSSSFWTVASLKAILPVRPSCGIHYSYIFSEPGTFNRTPISRYFLDQVLSNRASSVPSHFREPDPAVTL